MDNSEKKEFVVVKERKGVSHLLHIIFHIAIGIILLIIGILTAVSNNQRYSSLNDAFNISNGYNYIDTKSKRVYLRYSISNDYKYTLTLKLESNVYFYTSSGYSEEIPSVYDNGDYLYTIFNHQSGYGYIKIERDEAKSFSVDFNQQYVSPTYLSDYNSEGNELTISKNSVKYISGSGTIYLKYYNTYGTPLKITIRTNGYSYPSLYYKYSTGSYTYISSSSSSLCNEYIYSYDMSFSNSGYYYIKIYLDNDSIISIE